MQQQTGIGPLGCRRDTILHLNFGREPEEWIAVLLHTHTHTATVSLPSKRLDLTNMTSNKADAIPDELKSRALETIEQRYPEIEWLHIYTDGSYLPETNKVGVGWYCRLFDDSLAA
ncbi:uncharacterized protein TNCV_2924791 [Trichonephila clavipes]|nr:uncharacterized protein TNCV_2924791 [Trichonephila clavipes]